MATLNHLDTCHCGFFQGSPNDVVSIPVCNPAEVTDKDIFDYIREDIEGIMWIDYPVILDKDIWDVIPIIRKQWESVMSLNPELETEDIDVTTYLEIIRE
jgi:hypothetical protein